MKREERYQDTDTFVYYNANPKNRITGDCVIRALCTAMDEPYEKVYRELFEFSMNNKYMLNDKKCYEKWLESKGWKKKPQPRKWDNTKYTGKEFCEELQDGVPSGNGNYSRILAKIGGHHIVAIIDKPFLYPNGVVGHSHKVYDIWDSTNGCIGNYWVKDRG